jgi:formamidopyrimidine-DNA glycosylase
MPELPEVEVTRRRIEPLLVGRTIRRVVTTGPSYFFVTEPDRLVRALKGRRVEALERVGKYLLTRFDDGARLLLHLGMTGQLFAADAWSPRLVTAKGRAALLPEQQRRFRPDEHTHLRLVFRDGGPDVVLRDVRKFGKCALVPKGGTDPRLEKLGVDALRARGQQLHAAAARRRIPIKVLLLDQTVLAGIGNIYADEALHRAGIRPTRRSDRLSASECDALMRAVHGVLKRSIATGGSSIDDWVQPDGSDGAYQNERRVYARATKPCLTCGATIRRIVLGARSSCFCPRCQR